MSITLDYDEDLDALGAALPDPECKTCNRIGALGVRFIASTPNGSVPCVEVVPCPHCVLRDHPHQVAVAGVLAPWMPSWASHPHGVCRECDGDGVTVCRCCDGERKCSRCGGSGADEVEREWSLAVASREVRIAGLVAIVERWSSWGAGS